MQRYTRRALVGAAVAVPMSAMVLIVAAQFAYQAQGCGSIDPSDPANYSVATIVNDTQGVVALLDCKGSYCSGPEEIRLVPGSSQKVHAACGVKGRDTTSWRVAAASGATLGYMDVESKRRNDGLTYLVSRASTSRLTPTPAI